ncbi:MAG: dihydropteroate synthase [bacterium]|nr:MAG: dihydropteroate synthase [bacterium]
MGNKDTSFPKIRSIWIGEKLFDFSRPKIMGVLNLAPDSFYDGGKYNKEEYWVGHTRKMLDEGADIIDLGAVSTRPGAEPISENTELERLLSPLKILLAEFPEAVFSIDTYHAGVARQCVETGAHLINDISGGDFDKKMFPTIADLKVPYVLMHIHGSPESMQAHPISENVENIICQFFKEKVAALRLLGVEDIILDPGFGFGKTLKSNYRLLYKIASTRIDNLPMLAGVSRKSMINNVIGATPSAALNGTTVVNTLALLNGTNLLRVHDVKEAREAIDIIQYYRNFGRFSK